MKGYAHNATAIGRAIEKAIIILVAGLLMSVSLLVQHAQAATGTIYLTPATASAENGSNFTTNVRINPGTAVDTVDVTLSFDASRVTYQTITYAGSPFTTQLGFSAGSNSIHFTSGYLGGSVNSDSFIATVTFKAAAGSGTTALSLSGSNAAFGGNPTGPSTTGATITLTSPPAPTCPAGQTGTPPNCVTPPPSTTTPPPTTTGTNKTSTGGTTSPVPTTPTPVSSANADIATTVDDQNIQFTVAGFTISSKAPTQVYIRYGASEDNMAVQTPLSSLATTHSIALDPAMLVPGQTYFYQVFSQNSKGQTVQAPVASFTTKGMTVKVGVYDKNHKALKNKKITIHSSPQTATTDGKGFVTFANLSPGLHTVSYEKSGKTYSGEVQVANNIETVDGQQVAALQSFSVVYQLAQGYELLSPVGLGSILAALLAIGVVAWYVRRNRSNNNGYGDYIPTFNTVTVGSSDTQASAKHGPMNEELAKRLENTPMPQTTTPGTVISSEGHIDQGEK